MGITKPYANRLLFIFFSTWVLSISNFYDLIARRAGFTTLLLDLLICTSVCMALFCFAALLVIKKRAILFSLLFYVLLFTAFFAELLNKIYVSLTGELYFGIDVLAYAITGPSATLIVLGSALDEDGTMLFFVSTFLYFSLLVALSWILASIFYKKIASSPLTNSANGNLRLISFSSMCLVVLLVLAKTYAVFPGFLGQVFLDLVEYPFSFSNSVSNINNEPSDQSRISLQKIARKKGSIQQKSNVVIIFLESVRDKSYGYSSMHLFPTYEKLANQSLVFRNARTIVPVTGKSIYATLCGMIPHLGAINLAAELQTKTPCLPALLNSLGYDTVFFDTTPRNHEYRLQLVTERLKVDHYSSPPKLVKEWLADWYTPSVLMEEKYLLPASDQYLRQMYNLKKPFLAIYVTFSPHAPYAVPKNAALKKLDPEPRYNNYLNTLYLLDAFLEKLITQYKKYSLYENTLFVLLGDHGEGFGEHGRYFHADVPYEEGIRVPLIIHHNSLRKKVIANPVDHVDILPSILTWLGYLPPKNYDGNSFFDFDHNYISHPKTHSFLHCARAKQCMAVLHGGWKYIYNFGIIPDELYYIPTDPEEKKNVIDLHPKLKHTLFRSILNWKQNINSRYKKSILDVLLTTGPKINIKRNDAIIP